MKRITTYLLAFYFLLGCQSFSKRDPAETKGRKHYILTLHGVRGNSASFGDFHELVKIHLEKMDPSYEVVPLNITYKTAQVDYTPDKAAEEINEQLDQQIPNFNPQDKLSVVAYSMGGQVGVAWYFNSLKDARRAKYPRQTANFISLGAAYWGALEPALMANDVDVLKNTVKGVIREMNAVAEGFAAEYTGSLSVVGLKYYHASVNKKIFERIDKLQSIADVEKFYDQTMVKDYYDGFKDIRKLWDLNETMKNFRESTLRSVAKISFAELRALSAGGATVTALRYNMMGYKDKLPTHWTSISTLVQCFETDLGSKRPGCDDFQNKLFGGLNKSFAKYSFGLDRRETDNAVITPSSIAQFHYVSDRRADYAEGQLTPSQDFRLSIPTDHHKTIFAETLHATLVTENIYERTVKALSLLGKSWERLADDVVIVHKNKCLTPEKCDHPVYKYILDELSDCSRDARCDTAQYNQLVGKFQLPVQQEKEIQEKLWSEIHGFTLELNLRLPVGTDLSKINDSNILNYIKMDFADKDSRTLKFEQGSPWKIQIGRSLELGSILVNKISYVEYQALKVNFTGLFVPNNRAYNYAELQNGRSVDFTIDIPGLKTRRVEALVSPSRSTFVDLPLVQK